MGKIGGSIGDNMIPGIHISLAELRSIYADSIGENDSIVMVKGVIPYTRWQLAYTISYLEQGMRIPEDQLITFRKKESGKA